MAAVVGCAAPSTSVEMLAAFRSSASASSVRSPSMHTAASPASTAACSGCVGTREASMPLRAALRISSASCVRACARSEAANATTPQITRRWPCSHCSLSMARPERRCFSPSTSRPPASASSPRSCTAAATRTERARLSAAVAALGARSAPAVCAACCIAEAAAEPLKMERARSSITLDASSSPLIARLFASARLRQPTSGWSAARLISAAASAPLIPASASAYCPRCILSHALLCSVRSCESVEPLRAKAAAAAL
mmetsp:Transcript_6385/g.15299  ORF Transcript_6385/g.15299 Transcript_6385/m.15299 type:complete len:256 (+) Transcript_6385:702-1469(+)